MSDQPESLLLVYLRRIDARLEQLPEYVADIKRRITSLETQVALLHGDFANQSARIDRIEERLIRIEKRLDLSEAPMGGPKATSGASCGRTIFH